MATRLDELRGTLREGILELQTDCLAEVKLVIQGKKAISDVTKEASKMIQRMLRVDQETRMERENAASLTMRFVKMLDGDDALRADYIHKTAPQLPRALLEIEAKQTKKKGQKK